MFGRDWKQASEMRGPDIGKPLRLDDAESLGRVDIARSAPGERGEPFSALCALPTRCQSARYQAACDKAVVT